MLELLLFILILLEAIKAFMQYKSLPKETKDEIKKSLPDQKPKLSVFTYKPTQSEEESVLSKTINKIFNK